MTVISKSFAKRAMITKCQTLCERDNAITLLESHIGYALEEYGQSTAMRWKKEIAAFEERILLI